MALPKPRAVVRARGLRSRVTATMRHVLAPWENAYFRGAHRGVGCWLYDATQPGRIRVADAANAPATARVVLALSDDEREALRPLSESERFAHMRRHHPVAVGLLLAAGCGSSLLVVHGESRTARYRVTARTRNQRRAVCDWLSHVMRHTDSEPWRNRLWWFRQTIRTFDVESPLFADGGWHIVLPESVEPPIALRVHRWEGGREEALDQTAMPWANGWAGQPNTGEALYTKALVRAIDNAD